jgi:hypothetical protein
MRLSFFIFVLFCSMAVGCRNSATTQAAKPAGQPAPSTAIEQPAANAVTPGAFQPFYVFTNKGSRENHYIPSGFMPDGNCLTFSDTWQENCRTEKTCIRVVYDIACSRAGQKWAGIYWLNPANNWGTRKGGYNLTGATKLTFWARGEKGGEQVQEFSVGGIAGDYPDSDTAVVGPVILGSEWREYTIDLRGKDLSYISGGFSWTSSEEVNPEDCTFYLDEIKFE